MEDDDVADLGVAEVVDHPVDEHALADVERGLHRRRGDLVRLDDEGLDQQRQADRQGDDHDQLEERAAPRCRLRDQVRLDSSESSAVASDSSEGSASDSARSSASCTAPPPHASSCWPRRSSASRLSSSPSALSASSPSSPPASDRLRLALGDALGVDRLALLGRDHELVLDAPAPLGDAGALADPAAQVVELGAPDVAPGHHLEPLDLRRVDREGPLDADAERLLADRERLARAGAPPGDHDTLEDLGAAAAALDDLEVHPHPVARREPRHPPQLTLLDALDDRAHGLCEGDAGALAARAEAGDDAWPLAHNGPPISEGPRGRRIVAESP